MKESREETKLEKLFREHKIQEGDGELTLEIANDSDGFEWDEPQGEEIV